MADPKRALITGITGQDGSYLTELLLAKGYAVHGVVRRTSNLVRSRIEHLRADESIYGHRLFLHYGDLTDGTTLRRIFARVQPAEVYHLAGQSHVGLSFEIPESTSEEVAMATLRLLEISRDQPQPLRFYHASSSEIFGDAPDSPQTEETPLRPASPYGCAKAFATQLARVYRRAYGLFVCNGILYNHESPRRGENFVTRKIARGAARISRGLETGTCAREHLRAARLGSRPGLRRGDVAHVATFRAGRLCSCDWRSAFGPGFRRCGLRGRRSFSGKIRQARRLL